jgi:hypothetical protein
MSFRGLLQEDLLEFTSNSECLLAIADNETELIDFWFEDAKNPQCQTDLSESTFATMMLLEEDTTGGNPRPVLSQMPSAAMSNSTLGDLSQLNMEQYVGDSTSQPTTKFGGHHLLGS